MKRMARAAAVTLLLLWVGPVSFVQNDTSRLLRLLGAPRGATADPTVIPAGQALVLKPGTPIKLRLRDGNAVKGVFLGRALLDSARYAERFAARAAADSAPIAMGETLRVTLHDGREMTGPLWGYGELTLLLRGPEGQPVRVPFEFAKRIVRANGETVEPRALARAFRSGALPSAEVLALEEPNASGTEAERWAAALQVPVEDIARVIGELDSDSRSSSANGLIVLGVIAVFVVLIVAASRESEPSGCGVSFPSDWSPLGALPRTERPFDLSRGCYLDDPLMAADPWPGAAPADLLAAEPLPPRPGTR